MRASHVINLGVTDQRCHDYKHITITGRAALDLISTSGNKFCLSDDALKSIGKLLMFVIDHILPTTTYPDIFKVQNKYEKEYITLFGQQLHITKGMGLNRFCIPAVSLLVNKQLNPHYDSLNPTKKNDDFTFSMNLQVPLIFLPPNMLPVVKKEFPTGVPLCIVLYKRNALCNFSKRMKEVDNYMDKKIVVETKLVSQYPGRRKLVELLRSVNSDNDYVGNFFSKHTREGLAKKFDYDKHKIVFKGKILLCPEAVDKMVCVTSQCIYIYLITSHTILSYIIYRHISLPYSTCGTCSVISLGLSVMMPLSLYYSFLINAILLLQLLLLCYKLSKNSMRGLVGPCTAC